MIAAVRVKGSFHLNSAKRETLKRLNLHSKNWCAVLEDNPSNLGMLKAVKDMVTWGPVSEDVLEKMLKERGEEAKEGPVFTFKKKSYKKAVRLAPPSKGYGAQGVKKSFKQGGALGDRGEEINDLLKRMI